MRKNKLTSVLLSFAVAFGLWLYVVTVVSPESANTVHNIPVVQDGEAVLQERNLMITAQSATRVALDLSGNRADLNKVDSNNITVKIDLSKITEPGEKIPLPYTYSFPGNVASNAIVVESKHPEYIYVTVEERRTKEVPVEVKWVGASPDGFMTDRENRILDYPYITVVGPASVADLIEKAVIEVDLNEQRESISRSYRYTLCDKDDEPVDAQLIATNVEEVHLDVKIQRIKEVSVQVEIVYGGGANEGNTTVDIDPLTIRLSGSEAVLEELGDSITLGKIDLSVVDKSQTVTFPINLPEGVTNLSNITEASVAIQFSGLATKEFVVDNITAIHVPEGMTADIITEKMTVTMRGPSADLAKLTEKDIFVEVDFTGAEVDTSTMKATVRCGEGFTMIGAVGNPTVLAEIKQA